MTPTHARHVFNTFVTTLDVARAASDERLELLLVNEAQLPLTVSAYERADYSGARTTRYRYGSPKLYVPQLKGFPLWFVAVVPRTPAQGGPTRTAIMVFNREEPADTWRLSVSTLLAPGATLPRVAVDHDGYATPLATFQRGLLASPNSVGALQAAVAADGPAARAATIVAAGPFTTGLYRQIMNAKHQVSRLGLLYDSVLVGTAFPLYALRTADGGGLVLYSLDRSAVIKPRTKQRRSGLRACLKTPVRSVSGSSAPGWQGRSPKACWKARRGLERSQPGCGGTRAGSGFQAGSKSRCVRGTGSSSLGPCPVKEHIGSDAVQPRHRHCLGAIGPVHLLFA